MPKKPTDTNIQNFSLKILLLLYHWLTGPQLQTSQSPDICFKTLSLLVVESIWENSTPSGHESSTKCIPGGRLGPRFSWADLWLSCSVSLFYSFQQEDS